MEDFDDRRQNKRLKYNSVEEREGEETVNSSESVRDSPVNQLRRETEAVNLSDSSFSSDSTDSETIHPLDQVEEERLFDVEKDLVSSDDEDLPTKEYTEEEKEIIRSEARELGIQAFLQKHLPITPFHILVSAFDFEIPLGFHMYTDDYKLEWFANRLNKYLNKRRKLLNLNSIDDAVNLIKNAQKILVLTGAGISVSCGIPDFRSEKGLYNTISETYPTLSDPQLLFDIEYFKQDPRPFFNLSKQIYPTNYKPSPTHMFIKTLEDCGKLLRNYTQNIDTIEKIAGIKRVVYCHGSFDSATCQVCKLQIPGDEIKDQILSLQIPYCMKCTSSTRSRRDDDDDEEMPIMKPDIVFFGEKLPDTFERMILKDRDETDLMIIIGSSLKVAPVNNLVGFIPHHVPIILINREPIKHLHDSFDIQLLGYSDLIVEILQKRLNWITTTTNGKDEEVINEVEKSIHLFKGNLYKK